MKKVSQKLFSLPSFGQNGQVILEDSKEMLGYYPLKHTIIVQHVDKGEKCEKSVKEV